MILKVVNVEKFAVAPSTVSAFVVPVNPVNPDRVLPVFNVNVPVVWVRVPVPESVLNVDKEVGMVGLFPSGSGQFALIDFVPVCPEKLTRLKVWLLQVILAAPPVKLTVPPLALKLAELMLTPPAISRSAGEVNDAAPLENTTEPEKYALLKLPKFKCVPVTVKEFPVPVSSEKPVIAALFCAVSSPPVCVNVPEPVIVPLRIKLFRIVGLFPSGTIQLLLMVDELLGERTTLLKMVPVQVRVGEDPLSTTVPPFALNVGEPLTEKSEPTVNVPLPALNVPPVITTPLLRVRSAGSVRVPELIARVPIVSGEYVERSIVDPATVRPVIDNPENPFKDPVLLTVMVVPAEAVKVNVPVPERVPLSVKARLLPTPF